MINYKTLYILLIISTLLFSCKTKQKLNNAKSAEILQVYNSIEKNYIDYSTLLIKSSVKFESAKKKINLKATIKILKDSLIIVSFSPGLGIEVARLMFTKDSLFILDRISSQLTRADYRFIKKSYNIDIQYVDIQSILTNQLFIYPVTHSTIKDEFIKSFSFGKGDHKLDMYRKSKNPIENMISIDNQSYMIKKYIINDISNKRNLTISFDKAYSLEYGSIPKKLNIISSFDGDFNKILLNYSKVSKNKSLNFSFKVPSKYKIIDIKM